MGRENTAVFITELPLRVTPNQESTILVRFEFARQLYNACLGEALRRLALMRQSKQYQSAGYIPKDQSHARERASAFAEARKAFRFSDYELQAYAAKIKISWIGSSVVQKVATRAFLAANRYAFGKAGRPRFKSRGQWDSLEGKQNTVIGWNGKEVAWGGLIMPAILSRPKREPDEVTAQALNAKVKYVRLLRRKIGGKNRFYAQLICEGLPYQKPKNKVGQGVLGADLGPSTIAVVAPDAQTAELRLFCAELESQQKQIRVLQRKLDRQRRANNPQNYNKDGTVKKGKKAWQKSKKYEQTQAKLADLCRKQAEHRKSLHGQLVNHIFSMGDEVKVEKLSYRAFQRIYGKSVGVRAPGMFVSMLKRKAVSAGVSVTEFSTRTTKLSQVCLCGQVKKKPLSQRWHICECGVVAQRDLFSAFLATCVEDEKLNADFARDLWQSGMDACLRAALSEVQPAIGGGFPASFGFGRRQSGAPVSFRERAGEGRGAVVSEFVSRQGREPGDTCPLSGTLRI